MYDGGPGVGQRGKLQEVATLQSVMPAKKDVWAISMCSTKGSARRLEHPPSPNAALETTQRARTQQKMRRALEPIHKECFKAP